MYVGKIAPTVDEATVQKLLEACGPVKEWKRMSDPVTNQLKARPTSSDLHPNSMAQHVSPRSRWSQLGVLLGAEIR